MNAITDNEVVEIVTKAFREMTAHIRERLNTPTWRCSMRMDFRGRRRLSWGGTRKQKPFISLALGKHLKCRDGILKEYDHYQYSPTIGSINSTVERALRALVAHELAHAVQYSLTLPIVTGKVSYAHGGVRDRGHGVLFQEIYRDLREKFVNNLNEGNTMTTKTQAPKTETPATVTPAVPEKAVKPPKAAKVKVEKPAKEPKVTNRMRVTEIVKANSALKTSEQVAAVMSALGIAKSYAYTYVYLARKDLGIKSAPRAAKVEAPAA